MEDRGTQNTQNTHTEKREKSPTRESNPEIVGPGKWDDMHIFAMKADTRDKQLDFIRWNTEMIETFPCAKCRIHAMTYILVNPMEDFINVTHKGPDGKVENIGMFIWSWKFHNSVNERLGKWVMDWDTAYNMYTSSQVLCSENCELSK